MKMNNQSLFGTFNICRNCKYYSLSGVEEGKTYCDHPKLYSDDPFCGVALETNPNDFCSYFELRMAVTKDDS